MHDFNKLQTHFRTILLFGTWTSLLFCFVAAPSIASTQTTEPGPSSQPAAQEPGLNSDTVSEPNDADPSIANQEATTESVDNGTAQDTASKKRVYRGSSTSVRNAFSAISLNPDAELTYNPTYLINLSLDPLVWMGDIFYVAGHVDVTHELTESDWTTYTNENYLSDTFFVMGAKNFYTVPFLDLNFSGSTSTRLPTSKASWARTMLTGLSVKGDITRSFSPGWIAGFNLKYGLSGTQFFHRYTTGEKEDSIEDGRCLNLEHCSIYASDGVRNVERAIANELSGSVAVWDWLVLYAKGQLITQWLYPLTIDERVSYHPENPYQLLEEQNQRYLTGFDAGISITPTPALTVNLGASTVHPQLKPDGEYRMPGFNRYTNFYFDLICNWDGLAASLLD